LIKIKQEASGLSQAGGGQEETRRRFAHERQIRPAKRCPHYSFGKNTMHHHQNIATY